MDRKVATVALIVAAGRGSRVGEGLPKQYRMLGRMSVLRRSVLTFLKHPGIADVQVVIHPDDEPLYRDAVGDLHLPPPVHGGATRSLSVRNGVRALMATGRPVDTVVFVHDAARPLISANLIDRCLAAIPVAPPHPTVAFVPALPVIDSLRRGAAMLSEQVDREGLFRVQTPQCFDLITLNEELDAMLEAGRDCTDEAGLMMEAGYDVAIIPGEERNFKLTTTEDFERAEALLARPRLPRTGMGFDVHAFEDGEGVWLGGVLVPHTNRLKGHSDADVALHAITDALLGTIAAGDIGDHFPPSDPQWKGAPSPLFLEHARGLVEAAGGRIEHVDLTIICEAPKVGPHRDAIRARIADLLRLSPGQISVKATTTERLGFTGRREGIAAQAIATVTLEASE